MTHQNNIFLISNSDYECSKGLNSFINLTIYTQEYIYLFFIHQC